MSERGRRIPSLLRGAALAAGLLFAFSPPAAADGSRSWTNVCSSGSFRTCASVQLQVSGKNVTMTVRNLSGLFDSYAGSVFTAIGLHNVPGDVWAITDDDDGPVLTMSGPSRAGDDPDTWRLRNDEGVGGGLVLDLAATTNGVDDGIASNCAAASQLPDGGNDLFMTPTCAEGGLAVANAFLNDGWVKFDFRVSKTWDPMTAGTEILIKAQNGPDGESTHCITGELGNCSPVYEQVVVPEPVSLLLLGSGLAGIGVVGVRRRREEEEEQ